MNRVSLFRENPPLSLDCFVFTKQEGCPGSSTDKDSAAVQETPVQFVGWEVPLREGKGYPLQGSWPCLVAQTVKNPPALRETWV